MPSELTLAEVEQVALLARLHLSDEEKERFQTDLGVILSHFEVLQQVDTRGVPETAHVLRVENVFRADAVVPGLARDEVMREAPEGLDEFFVVPRVVEA